MFALAYSMPLALRGQLIRINKLRETLLTLPLTIQQERFLQWDAIRSGMRDSLAMAGISVTNQTIQEALVESNPRVQTDIIRRYHATLMDIATIWRGNPQPVTLDTVDRLSQTLSMGSVRQDRPHVLKQKSAIQKLLSYLQTGEEHPVVQSAVILGQLSAGILPTTDSGLLGRLLARLYLAKYGYDARGLITPETIWHTRFTAYQEACAIARQQEHLTHWLTFFADTIEQAYIQAIDAARHADTLMHTTQFPGVLTPRQHRILYLCTDPQIRLTNKLLQKRLGVSQLTASRELGKLTIAGILRAHGKGRSVFYSLG